MRIVYVNDLFIGCGGLEDEEEVEEVVSVGVYRPRRQAEERIRMIVLAPIMRAEGWVFGCAYRCGCGSEWGVRGGGCRDILCGK